jgi:DNA-directed RNA polymerase I subunit RPA2
MTPDIIINPHAFPSRMTIGMLVESMAGKAGALHGTFQDSTPFRFHENHRAADYFGDQLAKAGYNYYGSEPLYSGVNGTELHCHIFIGVVYYQRLRHMVSDKSQVRSSGPVNSLTMQPVKGRKRGGGVRFGEMERDSLLAHGTAYLLQDRLMNSSDRHDAHACMTCGAILGFDYNVEDDDDDDDDTKDESSGFVGARGITGKMRCRSCRGRKVGKFAMPYVVRYLANELAAMNICLSVELKA